jgi:hypothetical protein
MDSLLAGTLILPWKGHCAGYDVQRRCFSKHSGQRESHSGLGRKPFAFPSESLFAFSPESCSSSPRNRFRVHPGILFALPRNPQYHCHILDHEDLGMMGALEIDEAPR